VCVCGVGLSEGGWGCGSVSECVDVGYTFSISYFLLINSSYRWILNGLETIVRSVMLSVDASGASHPLLRSTTTQLATTVENMQCCQN